MWAWRRAWYASSIGLTLPTAVALDQLIRHPAMTPKRLLTWLAPVLAAQGAIVLFASHRVTPDPVVGWSIHFEGLWRGLAGAVQAGVVAGLVGVAGLLWVKVPSRPVRTALAALMAAQGYLAVDGVLLALGQWYFRPFLFSEMACLLALWFAFETAHSLQTPA